MIKSTKKTKKRRCVFVCVYALCAVAPRCDFRDCARSFTSADHLVCNEAVFFHFRFHFLSSMNHCGAVVVLDKSHSFAFKHSLAFFSSLF